MMRPDSKVEKVYLYPKPVDFRKSIDGLTALVELDIKVAVFDPVLSSSSIKPVTASRCCIGSATASAFGSSASKPSVSKLHPTRPTKLSC